MQPKATFEQQLGWQDSHRIRFHGNHGPPVIALHGGPGAFGDAFRLARGLACEFRVLEPWQRRSGDPPLTVAVHIGDLHGLIQSRCSNEKPAIVGSSWGAMLALAFAAEHSDSISAIALVGCGTFDKASRDILVQKRKQKIADYIAGHPEHEADLHLPLREQMMKWHGMTDTYEPLSEAESLPESEPFDMRGHIETWQDMLRCQQEGLYPGAFASVRVPVIMLHGAEDPHPGPLIRDTLKQHIPHLEYHEFSRCGHEPETEKFARDDFFSVLNNWLKKSLGVSAGSRRSH